MPTRPRRRFGPILLALGVVSGIPGWRQQRLVQAGRPARDEPVERPVDAGPATTNHIVSMQVAYQIFETLVKLEPGGTQVVPGLARSWSTSDGGRVWRFRLEEDVRFHDDTRFNAAAVCANFERWYHFTGILQSPSVSGVWRTVFGGFATSALPGPLVESLYRSCDAPAELEPSSR